MNMTKKSKLAKLTAIALGVAAATFLAAGCGNNEKAAPAASNKTVVKLVIASNEPPLGWADEKGQLHGYEYDIWQEVAKKLPSYQLDIQAFPPETMDIMLESGDAKIGSEGYYRNAQREKNFLIPKTPIGASALVGYVVKGNETKYHNLNDIAKAGLKIAPLTPNGGAFRILTDWNEKNGKPFAEIPIQAGLTQAERINGLKVGQYDVLITPNNLGVEDTALKLGVEVVAIEEPIKVNETVVLVNKNEAKLSQEIDDALKALKADGTLSKISKKWYKDDLFRLLK